MDRPANHVRGKWKSGLCRNMDEHVARYTTKEQRTLPKHGYARSPLHNKRKADFAQTWIRTRDPHAKKKSGLCPNMDTPRAPTRENTKADFAETWM
jgi:hypothetical protein